MTPDTFLYISCKLGLSLKSLKKQELIGHIRPHLVSAFVPATSFIDRTQPSLTLSCPEVLCSLSLGFPLTSMTLGLMKVTGWLSCRLSLNASGLKCPHGSIPVLHLW